MNASLLHVTVTARQPLALGVASEVSFFTDSHPYVPGSVLRGALAAAWIADYGPPAAGTDHAREFQRLFDGAIRFGPLYPVGSHRTPLSVLRCKYPINPGCAAAAVDAAFEAVGPCPGCDRPLEPSKGELDTPTDARPRRVVRTSIDQDTMRAKEGELYAHAAIPAGTVLTGTLYGRDRWLEQPRELRLGGRRSVGGAADYTATPATGTPPPATAELVIRLASPAVFVDIAGRPRLDPDPTLDLPDGVHIERAWVRRMIWSGWHAASRLPKPPDLCATPGSTYRLTGAPQVLADLAERLLRDGVGLRRVEGFGVTEIATAPWRPPQQAPPTEPAAADTTTAGASAALVQQRLQLLRDLGLQPPEQRWLIGALRGLQIEQQRGITDTTHPATLDKILDQLLAQPTAADLSGRQRETIRTAVADLDPTALRDLTTLTIDVFRDTATVGDTAGAAT
jgi:CRISPR-associated protein Csx10